MHCYKIVSIKIVKYYINNYNIKMILFIINYKKYNSMLFFSSIAINPIFRYSCNKINILQTIIGTLKNDVCIEITTHLLIIIIKDRIFMIFHIHTECMQFKMYEHSQRFMNQRIFIKIFLVHNTAYFEVREYFCIRPRLWNLFVF